jgi:hypothetical protein
MPAADWQVLWKRNPHPRDKRIYFIEQTHTYFVDGSSEGNLSTTKFLHAFFPHFDAEKTIKKMMAGRNWTTSKYYGKTLQQIMGEWNENGRIASEAGTKMHLAIEQYLNEAGHIIPKDILATPEWKYFMSFWQDHGSDIEPYRLEWEVFTDPQTKLTGSIDGVFRRKSDGKFLIYDWKRSKEIKSANLFGGIGFPPVEHIQDTNYWHYTLQLNVYRWILETYYGLQVADMYLVILHPDNKSYKRMRLNRLDDEVADMIQARRRAVAEGCKQDVILPLPSEEEDDGQPSIKLDGQCIIKL